MQAMHQTVREFFLRDDGCVATSKFRMVESDAHVSMSITCIRYLMLCAANMAARPSDVKNWTWNQFESCVHYLNQRPLASYALMHLKDHLDRCRGDPHVSSFFSQFIDGLTRTSGGAVYLLEGWASSNLKKVLLSSQTDDTAKGFRDRLLGTAVRNGFSEATELLVLAGANIQLEDKYGLAPLLRAAEAGHEAVVRVLLEYKVNAGITDGDGRTALSWAARNGHERVVRLLLEYKAVDNKDNKGRTALS